MSAVPDGFPVGIPVIQSEGRPPERHAARVVAEMCRWLAADQPRLMARHVELLRGASLGNPKGQARFMRRLRHDPEMRGRLLATSFKPGKRAKCHFRWLTWAPVTADGYRVGPKDPIPASPWLACLLEELFPKDMAASHSTPLVTFTHHAMQRLAERCDARTPIDLLNALREIGVWFMINEDEADEATHAVNRGEARTLRIPVGGGVAIVESADNHGWLVKTVLDAAWVDTPR